MAKAEITPQKKSRERRAEIRLENNILRSSQMHKVRMAHPASESAQNTPEKFNVGCSGWFYWDWRNHFYKDIPTSKWFEHYKKNFNTVELNAPFYSWPTVATVKSWVRQAKNSDFIYTIKASELITHVKRFTGTKTLVKDFNYITGLVAPRMGCLLFQLPPSFHYTAARLKNILSQLDPEQRNVVEFRHASWWRQEVYVAFHEAGVIFCSSSSPKLPDELIKTTDEVYIRFHGKGAKIYRYNYTQEELNIWIDRIKKSKTKRVWAYFNNDYEGHAIRNGKDFIKLLKKL